MRASEQTSIEIRAGSVELSLLARQRLIERVRAALDAACLPVARVELALFENADGARSCALTLEAAASFEVVVREAGPFLNPMIDVACQRAVKTLETFEHSARRALTGALTPALSQRERGCTALPAGAVHELPELPDE